MSADPEAGQASDHNRSTEHQPNGSARNPSDTLDRDATQNASVRRGGEAAGGVAPKEGDPTGPADADARAAERDRAQRERGLGNDEPATDEG
jgi:hypothetical protein